LTGEQRQRLLKVLALGAATAGFSTERWTLRRVARVIEREFSVTYHPRYLSRQLKSLGWSVQQPVPRAREHDEELVRA
jgi:transposase